MRAFEVARVRGLRTLALVGRDGGELRGLADIAVVVPAADTQHIQEVHTVLVHTLCEIVEEALAEAGWFAGASSTPTDGWAAEPRRRRAGPAPVSRPAASSAAAGRGARRAP